MSGRSVLTITLPPPSILRDLTITAIALIGRLAKDVSKDIEVRPNPLSDSIDIVIDPGLWPSLMKLALDTAHQIIDIKSSRLRAPRLNFNDFRYVFRRLSKDVSRESTYLDGFKYVLSNSGVREDLMDFITCSKELSSIGLVRVRGKDVIAFGTKGLQYPMPQILKVEMYETGLTFHKPYTLDISGRLSNAWLGLLSIGFSVAYAGMFGANVALVTLTEESLSRVDVAVPIEVSTTLINVNPDPIIPYILYISLRIPDLMTDKGLASYLGSLGISAESLTNLMKLMLPSTKVEYLRRFLKVGGLPKLKVHTMGVTRVFTVLNRAELSLEPTLRFAYLLDNICGSSVCRSEELISVVGLGLGGNEPKVLNALTYLYEAINRAKSPYEATYILLRTIAELRAEAEAGRGRAVRISKECLNAIVKALEAMS
ncbi:MAG: hypothetical protein DRO18_02570 [Thermoprotei archaeon]|nr:MAG: hypothetical protein DRO18_02570 [Thermoprotei archaeon]HDN76028.1 hypothetical protein [Acidilobales archaeon]